MSIALDTAASRLPLLLVLLCAGCPGDTASNAKRSERAAARNPKTVVLNGNTDPARKPSQGGSIDQGATLAQIFVGLTQFDEELLLTPGLAETWESEDLQTYSFVLHPNLRWSDGAPLTAKDVEASFERFLRDATDWLWVLEPIQGARAFRDGKATRIEGITVQDERHLTLSLTERDGLFLHLLALVPAAVYKPGATPDAWPIGAGPWRPEGLESGRLVLVPNQHYVGPKPQIDRLEIVSRAQSPSNFRSGGVDVLDLTETSPSVGGRVANYPGLNVTYGVFHKRVPKNVRVIVNRALNRTKYCATALRGHAVPARGVLPPGMPGHRPALPSLSAGEVPKLADTYRLSARLDAALFKQLEDDLRPHKVILVPATNKKAPDLTQHGWIADYPDPDNFLRVLFHSKSGGTLNYARFSNPEFDRLVTDARRLSAELEQGARMDLYQQAEDLILEDMPWLFLWHTENVIAVNERVSGLRTCANDHSGYLELPQTTLQVADD